MESALSIKGQATIPKAIREHLHLGPGDRIKFFLHPDGTVVILPKIATSRLKGIITSAGKRITLAQMDAAVAGSAMAGSKRGKRR